MEATYYDSDSAGESEPETESNAPLTGIKAVSSIVL